MITIRIRRRQRRRRTRRKSSQWGQNDPALHAYLCSLQSIGMDWHHEVMIFSATVREIHHMTAGCSTVHSISSPSTAGDYEERGQTSPLGVTYTSIPSPLCHSVKMEWLLSHSHSQFHNAHAGQDFISSSTDAEESREQSKRSLQRIDQGHELRKGR